MTALILSDSPLDLAAISAYEQDEEMRSGVEIQDEEMRSGVEIPDDLPEPDSSVPSLDEDEDNDSPSMAADSTISPSMAADSAIDDMMDEILAEDSSERLGGLSNLGNSCYMASSLQMLASVESLISAITKKELPLDKDNKLRSAFIELMSRLKEGETVLPEDFKAAIDERSALFAGFQQQDAHEFLVTFLDVLDEDYKVKPSLEDVAKEEEKEADTEDMELEDNEDNDVGSARKRAKTEEDSNDTVSTNSPPRTPLRGLRSFLDLNVEDIGRLLYGSPPTSRETVVFATMPPLTPPRYKLVGGRMNPSGATLTAFESAKKELSSNNESVASPSRPECTDSACTHAAQEDCKSPIESSLQTSVCVRLTCDSCKYTRTHKETFLHLSLEIGPDSGSVEEGLRRFFAPEKRELKCEKCFAESATQTMEITELPKALLLHFKRFIVDVSPDYTSVSYRKNQSVVAFDDRLEYGQDSGGVLTEFLATDCQEPEANSISQAYALRSVVNHIGSTANCGHYTADSEREYSNGTRRWTRFNDSYVSGLSPAEAIDASQRTAYMVMYEVV
jgi:ubiquitin C-terminal hydrolase